MLKVYINFSEYLFVGKCVCRKICPSENFTVGKCSCRKNCRLKICVEKFAVGKIVSENLPSENLASENLLSEKLPDTEDIILRMRISFCNSREILRNYTENDQKHRPCIPPNVCRTNKITIII